MERIYEKDGVYVKRIDTIDGSMYVLGDGILEAEIKSDADNFFHQLLENKELGGEHMHNFVIRTMYSPLTGEVE